MSLLLGILGTGEWLLKGVLRPLKSLWNWVTEDWRNGPLLVASLAFAVNAFVIVPRVRADLARAEQTAVREKNAHDQTIERFRAATEAATQRNRNNILRIRTEQAVETGRIVDGYETRLAAARSRAAELDRVHRPAGAAGADTGSAREGGAPRLSRTATRADEAAADHRLPAEGPTVTLTLSEALIATEQAIQLDALIDWVEAQAAIDLSDRSQADE